jgi:hypothetical protein
VGITGTVVPISRLTFVLIFERLFNDGGYGLILKKE